MKSRALRGTAAIAIVGTAVAVLVQVASRDGVVHHRPDHWIKALEPKVAETPQVVDRGKQIYEKVCFLCHGSEGKGNGKVAGFLVTKPRDFTSGKFKVRTTPTGYLPTDEDLFRTVTQGFPEYGMPSFYFLSREDRWGLVYYLKQFDRRFRDEEFLGGPVRIPKAPASTAKLIELGKEKFTEAGCAKCHGEKGGGDGPSAPTLEDEWGYRSFALDFTRGPKMFKGGGRREDVYRTLLTGMTGTPMPSYAQAFPDRTESLWALAAYVEDLATQGETEKRAAWEAFYQHQEASYSLEEASIEPPEENWEGEISRKFRKATLQAVAEKACLACHEGIEDVNEKMKDYLFALGAGQDGRLCVVCHEGNPDATTKEEAHKGLFPNPGSLWVVSVGKGCGKCHSDRNALVSLQAMALPEPQGGALLEVESTSTDPSGASGSNHVYRMQRGLMATEFGKASHTLMSNGVVPKGEYVYSDYHMDDPDGAVPSVGSGAYKNWIHQALETGAIKRVERSLPIPTFAEGVALWQDEVKAAFSDYYRKECGRCHVWEEGRRERGDLRAGGCAACHVIYTNDGVYEGNDPTIPKNKGVHPMKHEITVKIPAAQCNHCHTRGKRIGTTFVGAFEYDYKTDGKAPPWDEGGNAQELLYTKDYLKVREDVHFERGIQCIDCHTSIDVHGDGNIYPTTLYQVEIQCADCHGTPDKFPWELPVGWGTRVVLKGQRGTFKKEGVEYLLTSRGNPRVNLVRIDNGVILTSFYDESLHTVPLLKEMKLKNQWKTEQGKVAMSVVSQHMEKLECYACHSTWAPQCYGCHTKYDRRELSTDWVLTGVNHDRSSGKQKITKTPGKVTIENRSFLRWEEPILGVNLKGKVSPVIPGCQVFFTYVDKDGNLRDLNKTYTTSDGLNSSTIAPVQPHANSIPARTCESCHTNPKTLGYGTANSRAAGKLDGDRPMFQNLAEGLYGDIPESKTAKWQVPKIPDFPYALDQLVTRSGKQVQNMPHVEDRPLNQTERDKVEREGLCVACHKHYNTPTWDRIRTNLRNRLNLPKGQALTPDQHDRAVEEAVKSLAE